MEIKQRLNRVTQKRRVLLPYHEALRLCDERQMPQANSAELTGQDADVIDEILDMLWQYDLQRTSIVRYARQALIGTDYDIGLRVTFNTDLSYRVSNLQLGDGQSSLPLFRHLAAGNHVLTVYVEDRNEPGTGVDRFWIEVVGDLSLPRQATADALPIACGNIVVPH